MRRTEFQVYISSPGNTTSRIHSCNMVSSDIENIENVQRRATKLIPSLKNLEYADRLRKLKMPTLKYRRHMIETFGKIVKNL